MPPYISTLSMYNQIFDHKEDFRLADEDREHIVKATIDRVRMAADETELEVYFAKVLGLLDEASRTEAITLLFFYVVKFYPTKSADNCVRDATTCRGFSNARGLFDFRSHESTYNESRREGHHTTANEIFRI